MDIFPIKSTNNVKQIFFILSNKIVINKIVIKRSIVYMNHKHQTNNSNVDEKNFL